MSAAWTADDLFEFLVTQVGFAPADRPGTLDVTFADIGLDSLAYLQLQTEVQSRFEVELPADPPQAFTLKQILAPVSSALGRGTAARRRPPAGVRPEDPTLAGGPPWERNPVQTSEAGKQDET